MKTIDKLLVGSFIPPFIVTFFIALFVLIMQFLWKYIDDIVGKGADLWMITELLGYLSVSLIPTALPIAVLISSVMVMGNLSERYELASLKSAGVPLFRIIRPLMVFTVFVSCFSFLCSNYLIPISNFKFKTRLLDIRRQKPTLSLEEGVFNDDFRNITIHIGKKGKDGKQIEDIIIDDRSNYNRDKPATILARKGEMFTTEDKQYFIMNLYEGTHYQEAKQSGSGAQRNFPYIRTSFREWNKVFDLSEFSINRSDERLYRNNQTMQSVRQLRASIDSIDQRISKRKATLYESAANNFYILSDSSYLAQKQSEAPLTSLNKSPSKKEVRPRSSNGKALLVRQEEAVNDQPKDSIPPPESLFINYWRTLSPKNTSPSLTNAKSYVRGIYGQAKSANRLIKSLSESKVKHIFEMHIKYSMACACFIFLFIGAPMGAIIRKGGFGYPLLIAIIFFMLYIVLNIFCKKLAETLVLNAVLAAWVPCLILFPIGLWLTYKAMNDSKVFNTDRIVAFFNRLSKKSNA